MATYTAPVADIAFLLQRVFGFDAIMAGLPGYEEVNAELAVSVMEEAGKFAAGVLEPLNRPGDEEGCTLENGLVTTPKGVAQAYRAFAEAGWCALSGDPEYGGQGLPRVLQILLDEMLSSANLSFGLFPGLTRGAVEAIGHHASAELKATYLPKMISGEWTGAMALTESSAGTDLGLLSTRAVPNGDGSFAITGTKIFISSGDQDFGGNIIHLVLARLPDAPKGVKGISLFLCPKVLVNADGSLGARNAMSVGALEHKMGIHAQPTCVMNYDGATGWLVGEAGRGLNSMFTMMNAERLFVGIQGLGIAEAANQKAVAYARERLQGHGADGTPGPVAIIHHPDVRKMLLSGRAFAEAARALAVWTALQMDIADHHPKEAVRKEADLLVALLTPVVKASFTDFGFETAVASQQVLGGHGYIREWGMEQFVRDARINLIYEGTNTIQSLDLLGRKVLMDGGARLRKFGKILTEFIEAEGVNEAMQEFVNPLADLADKVQKLTMELGMKAMVNKDEVGAAAVPYLRVAGHVAFSYAFARMAQVALRKIAAGEDTPFYQAKLQTARFYFARLYPESAAAIRMARSGAKNLTDTDAVFA